MNTITISESLKMNITPLIEPKPNIFQHAACLFMQEKSSLLNTTSQLKKHLSKSNEESCRRLVSGNCFAKITVTNDSFKGQKNMVVILWIRFNRLKVAEPLEGHNFLLTTMCPGVPISYLMNLRRMKD